MKELMEAVPRWAKLVAAVAAALGILWRGVTWGVKVADAVVAVPRIERSVDRAAIERALIYCELRAIPPVDCEMPDEGD